MPCDRSQFGEIHGAAVIGLDDGLTKVADVAVGVQVRAAGIPLERTDIHVVLAEVEVNGGHPDQGREILVDGFHAAQQKTAFIAAAKEGVTHAGRDVGGIEVERSALVVPEQLAAADLEMADGKCKELFDRRLGGGPLHLGFGKIGAAVAMNNQVDDRMFHHDGVEAELGCKQGDDSDASHNPVDVGQRDLVRRLGAMDGQAANFHLQAKWDGVIGAEFDPAAGGLFQRGHDMPAHERLKGIGGHVPRARAEHDEPEQK